MNIIFNLKENESLSEHECEKIVALLRNHVAEDICLSISVEPQVGWDSSELLGTLTRESLLHNLIELQRDALEIEKQVVYFKKRNNYLEEKVSWLRSRTGKSNFKPLKSMLDSSPSLGDSGLQSALVRVINTLESKASEKASLSFSKSKRMRKDKALIAQSEFFDKDYVTSQLKMLGLQVKDPLEFFISFGAELELSPSEKFDTKSYLAMNPDVKDSGTNPLLHYIKHGKAEGRVLI